MTLKGLAYGILCSGALTVLSWGCSGRSSNSDSSDADTASHPLPDTLRVATLYSPTSFFIYREQKMGYDYDLVTSLCNDKGMVLQLEVAPSLASAVEMLDSGLVDLIAYEVPVTAQYKQHVMPCGVESITHQVLVQPKAGKGMELITDVTQLVGKDVYVEKGSKYHQRMTHLNDELGGGINIHSIDRDTLITEDLISMVNDGTIPLTVVDSDIARINKTYYNDLDVSLDVSFEQRAAWGVSPSKPWLADSISQWTRQSSPRAAQAALLKRYFEMSKRTPTLYTFNFSKGRISPFDHLFKQYAKDIGWDWRLLAAQGYAESRFDSTQVSWAGARGVMQIMPATARAYGLTADNMAVNDRSIATATRIIAALDRTLRSRVKDPDERRKFIIAAYNSGLAHILDAIALAEKYGYDPQRWDGHVAQALLLKSKPEYYNDPVCKYGYFSGRQTTGYVREVYEFYQRAKSKIHI